MVIIGNLIFSSPSGYRERLFVKVYAAAFYVDCLLSLDTEQWKEKIGVVSFDDSSVFDSIFKGKGYYKF